MQKVRILVLVCALAGAAVVAAPSYGQGEPPEYTVFVSSLTGEQILKIEIFNGTTVKTTAIFTGSPGFRPEDIAVGPDNKVYVCDPTNSKIIRIKDDGTSFGNGSKFEIVYMFPQGSLVHPEMPQGPRFDALGNLYFNTKEPTHTGIWRIEGVASFPPVFPIPDPELVVTLPLPSPPPSPPTSIGGEGLAFANNGDLLIVDASNNRVLRSPDQTPDPAGPSPVPVFGAPADIITSGLDIPTGIARDSGDSSNRKGRIYVANGGALNNIVRCDDDGSPCTTFVSFGPNDRPFYFEIALDNTLFVATSDLTFQNGKLWRLKDINSDGVIINTNTCENNCEKTLVKALPKRKGKFPPAIGVALAATSREITKTFSSPDGTTQKFDFGGFFWQVSNLVTGTCNATVKAQQKTPVEVANLLSTNFATSTALTFKGEGGFVIVFIASHDEGCFSEPTSIYAAAYIANAFSLNPRMVRDYVVDEDLVLFRYDPISELPGDPGMGANTNNFSEFVLVDRALNAGTAATFCGFETPLNPDPNNPSTFTSQQTIAVKFRLSTLSSCTSAFVTDADALVSVAKILPLADYERKNADPSGSSNVPPKFRHAGATYIFDLQLTGYTPGTYQISVVFLTDNATVQTIKFKVVD